MRLVATNHTDNRRELLKHILKGSATLEQLRQLVQAPVKDYSPLTPEERRVLQDYQQRHEQDREFATFSSHEMRLFKMLLTKVTPEASRRHLLDRMDLTAIRK